MNDAEAAKAFLSRCSDYMRPAYGHKVVEFMRHNVFAATTNETNFLQGDNGTAVGGLSRSKATDMCQIG